MADIVILGMEMPENCVGCPLFICEIGDPMACRVGYRMLDNRMVNESKPEWCPIIPLPEGHGRLIDADALFQKLLTRKDGSRRNDRDSDGWPNILEVETVRTAIEDAPTIVPAEGGGEDG